MSCVDVIWLVDRVRPSDPRVSDTGSKAAMINRSQPLLAAVCLLVLASFVSALANAAIITFSSASKEENVVVLAATTYSTSPSTDSVTIGALGARGNPFSGPTYNFVSPWKTVILSPPVTGIADTHQVSSPAVGNHCVTGGHRVTFKAGGSSTTASAQACTSVTPPPTASLILEWIQNCNWLVTSNATNPGYTFIIEHRPSSGGAWSQTYSGTDACVGRLAPMSYRAVYQDMYGNRGPYSSIKTTYCILNPPN